MFIRLLFILGFLISTTIFSQVPDKIQRFRNDNKGNYNNRKEDTFYSNNVKSLFNNDGEIGQWPYQPSVSWPSDSGHSYIDGYTFLISAEVIAPGDSQVIHPLETAYRAFYSMDPYTHIPWGIEPVSGYNKEGSNVAQSNNSSTWPKEWPQALNLPASANGHWYGYFGIDSIKASNEIFSVLDDSQDKKFTRAPYNYYPISSDSSRGGLGLRVETRIFQWDDSLRNDIVFINYNIWNISDNDYNKTIFGLYFEPGVGGSEHGPNSSNIDLKHELVYSWNPDGVAFPDNWKTGYVGIGILEGPSNSDMVNQISFVNASHSGSIYSQTIPMNNEIMWKALTSGIDTSIENANLSTIVGVGPFKFEKWTNQSFSDAIILGHNLDEIIRKKEIAQQIYDNNFEIPDTIITNVKQNYDFPSKFNLSQSYPNPFNPITTIRYSISSFKHVTLKIYDILGSEIETLVDEVKPAGTYEVNFNGSRLSSGTYFYRLQSGNSVETKKLILLK